MHRRHFLNVMMRGALAGVLAPRASAAETDRILLADMHTHLGFRDDISIRSAMAQGNMLIVADKITPDGPLLNHIRGRSTAARAAKPGALRRNFEQALRRRLRQIGRDELPHVNAAADIDRAFDTGEPAVVIAAEGADFLEADVALLDKARAQGLVHLQLVHYYTPSFVGDVSTEPARHGGLTPFGQEVVRACNRLGILLDTAHCTSAGIEQTLAISTKPIVYSHGHASRNAPHASQDVVSARAIHEPLAHRIAEKGGVIGLWPLQSQFADLGRYADELISMTKRFGARHVGVGTDMFGLPRSVIEHYGEFARLPEALERRGVSRADAAAVLGGNYLRVLRQALTVTA